MALILFIPTKLVKEFPVWFFLNSLKKGIYSKTVLIFSKTVCGFKPRSQANLTIIGVSLLKFAILLT